jgi:hypothetical protein
VSRGGHGGGRGGRDSSKPAGEHGARSNDLMAAPPPRARAVAACRSQGTDCLAHAPRRVGKRRAGTTFPRTTTGLLAIAHVDGHRADTAEKASTCGLRLRLRAGPCRV